MLISIIFPVFLIFAVVTSYQTISTKNYSKEQAELYANTQAGEYSNIIKNDLENTLSICKTLVNSISNLDSVRPENRRNVINHMIKDVLTKNPDLLGVWTVWEPNTLDGLDTQYANKSVYDSTSRYNIYWTNYNKKISSALATEPNKYDVAWYTTPKNTGNPVIDEPEFYDVQGNKVYMTSISVGILKNNVIVGVLGINLSIDYIQKLCDDIKFYDTGYASIVSNKGTIVAHSDKNLVGKNINEVIVDKKEDFSKFIASTEEGVLYRKAEETKNEELNIFDDVSVGEIKDHWTLVLAVPSKEIFKANNNIIRKSIFITLIGLTLIILLSSYITKSMIV